MSAEASSILRHGPLTRFWLARVATSVAYQMQAVAVGWQLYDLTNNPVDLGLVGLIQFIPVLLLILVTGQIVDRHERGMVLALAQAVEVAGALVLALATLGGVIGAPVIFCTVFVLGVRVERTAAKREPFSTGVLLAGIAFIRNSPIVLGALSLDLFAVLLGGATALLPIFARDVFEVGPWGLGILRAAPAVGALAISGVLMWAPLRNHVGRAMFAAVVAFGVSTIVFAWSTSLALTLAALAVLGASDMFSIVIRQTLVQLETPDAMRGRVSAVNTLFVGTANRLGDFRAGLMAAWFGAAPAVLIGGLGILAVVVVWAKVFPALYRVERFPST
jgi:MFS family permease